MTVLSFIAAIMLNIGLFLLLRLHPLDILNDIKMKKVHKEDALWLKIRKATKVRQKRGIRKLLEETVTILEATGRTDRFSGILLISLCLFIVGAFVASVMDNLLLLPVLAVGLSMLPFWYILFTASRWKKDLNNELETTLSIITTSYLRSESILTAIDENIEYIGPPLYDVFRSFLNQTRLINANIKLALLNLKPKIDSAVFHEWIDAVIACQEDKNLKSTLTPIVSKLSDMRVVSAELDYLLYEPVKEFVTMAVLLVANIPLMYFLNKDWYDTLIHHTVGKAVLAFCGMLLFVSVAGVVRLGRPVEYER